MARARRAAQLRRRQHLQALRARTAPKTPGSAAGDAREAAPDQTLALLGPDPPAAGPPRQARPTSGSRGAARYGTAGWAARRVRCLRRVLRQ